MARVTFLEAQVDDIVIPEHRRKECDPELVSAMAESVKAGVGILHPICVRRVDDRLELVTGLVRLEVCRQIGHDTIWCRLFQGDKKEARLAKLGEDLWRKDLSALERSVLITKYFHLASAQLTISGQPVRKRGRPYGGASLAARKLPVIARSVEARRKVLTRSFKIANNIPLEVQKAAIAAGLDDNQDALLKIANVGSVRAQLATIDRLRNGEKLDPSPAKNARFDTAEAAGESHKGARSGARGSAAPECSETTLLDLERQFCTQEAQKLWAHAPLDVREAFIDMARRKRCKARRSVTEFVSGVFRGQRKIPVAALKNLARKKGLSWKAVATTLRALHYTRKRKGYGPGAQQFFLNPSNNWKDETRSVSSAAISAALEEEQSRKVILKKGDPYEGYEDDRNEYYYED